MNEHYDELETRDPEAREASLADRLPRQIAHAKAQAPAYASLLKDVDPHSFTSRAALAGLPVLRKSTLVEEQRATPPFGGLNAIAPGEAGRIFTSPGPIYELEARESDYRRMARALYAAGFRAGELLHNSFAYHLTPGGWIMDWGARALGCAVIAAGTGQSEQQAQAVAQLRPQGYGGTPDFLKVILDKGEELGLDCSSIVKGLVSGGALFPSLRQEYAARGVAVQQCYAIAELGLIAYETPALEGMVVDEDVLVEIVRPGTGDPVADGEVGEVVVTTFNAAYPMLRLATGDLSAVLPGQSPCGRTNMRIKGWMGRADQTTKIKGMFVHPAQVAEIVKRHPEIAKARLVVTRQGESDAMTLHCESGDCSDALVESIAQSLASVTKLKGEVKLVAPGELANDGLVIEDARSYD
ncbi:MAG: AMP-binding protein [Rhodovibrionaceae bacterium]